MKRIYVKVWWSECWDVFSVCSTQHSSGEISRRVGTSIFDFIACVEIVLSASVLFSASWRLPSAPLCPSLRRSLGKTDRPAPWAKKSFTTWWPLSCPIWSRYMSEVFNSAYIQALPRSCDLLCEDSLDVQQSNILFWAYGFGLSCSVIHPYRRSTFANTYRNCFTKELDVLHSMFSDFFYSVYY